jgi:hypothetical protein
VNALNNAAPELASIITIIRNTDGTLTVLEILDQADSAFDANLAMIAKRKEK